MLKITNKTANTSSFRRLNIYPSQNNIFNNTQNIKYASGAPSINYFNTTLDCSNLNIIGGSCTGGNFWTDSDGNFSDTCQDTNGNGICDSSYTLASDNIDYYPLSATPTYIYLESPSDKAINTTDRTPDFAFNTSDSYSETFSCELFINRTDTGTGTPTGYGMNTSVLNNTSTAITANTSLVDGTYDWWINCTNSYSKENQSEIRNISISVGELTCDSCVSCSDIIQNQAQAGDIIKLTENLTGISSQPIL